jgi:Arc/MetJ-type ribon-helix-helix transcriptional regulator
MTSENATETVRGWFTGRLPQEWFTGPVEITIDREEIAVIGSLAAPETAEGVSDAERSAAVDGRVKGFREDTREHRIAIAREAEHRFGRKVAWGVECDGRRALFTHLSVPVMTRLRQPERRVLDTLVEAGVARSRSEALAWAVRLVGEHSEDWLRELREAMEQVRRVREQGPESSGDQA